MLRARHPYKSSRDEGPTGLTRGGGRVVYSPVTGHARMDASGRANHQGPPTASTGAVFQDGSSPAKTVQPGSRYVYAMLCKKCGRAVIYGDDRPCGEAGEDFVPVPLSRVHRKPACTCGNRYFDALDAGPQQSLFTEEACT